MNGPALFQQRCNNFAAPIAVAAMIAFSTSDASASPDDDVRAVFTQFVASQNSHDLAGVRDVLLDSPGFLWVTRGMPVWGRDAALKRFETLYQGTWKLSPDGSNLKVVFLNDTTAQLFVPILFNIAGPGQVAPDAPFLMNQTVVKTGTGWRIANILPIPLPLVPLPVAK
jgi:hypothetical protein